MSLTLIDARARAEVLRQPVYEVDLDLSGDESFTATTRLRFAAEAGSTSFLDLQHARRVRVVLNGAELSDVYRDDQIHLTDLQADNEVVVEAEMPYVTDGDGMHRFVDPADGGVYIGCYGGMDVNRRVFACADQPDLKAPFTVTVTARPGWTVVSNGRAARDGDRWTFATTPPVATYLVSVCAGPFATRAWEHAGLPFAWHARASLAAALDRDLGGLQAVTEGAFDWYARTFDEPYPFDSYDQLFVPGHNWGAMECPGVVSFRDEMLPQGATPEALARGRAMVIAHEMAHMWFGDLVTFRWWEDTWLNESFADLMGFWVAGAVLEGANAFAEFEIGRKAGGYAADARPSTHPVAPRPEHVPDVDSAFNNFDPISYAKGNACLRQLSFWLGEDTFFAGVNAHLSGSRFGTATLDDFVTALASVTDRDVTGWVDAWLRTSGHDTLLAQREGDAVVLRREGSCPHRLRVSGYAVPATGAGPLLPAWEEVVDLGAEPVRLPAADLVLPNSTGDTFATVVLDGPSAETLRERLSDLPDAHHRAVAWAMLLDAARRGEVRSGEMLGLAERHLAGESDPVLLEHALRRLVVLLRAAESPDGLRDATERLARVALSVLSRVGLDGAAGESATDTVILTTHDGPLLRAWLEAGGPTGPLTPTQRWDALLRLAQLHELPEALLQRDVAADRSETGRLGALTVAAAHPTGSAKEEGLRRLLDAGASNREIAALARGVFDPERRDLVDPLLAEFLDGAVAVAARGQALGLVVGRATPAFRWRADQLALLDAALARPDLAPVLARTWADLAHDQRLLG
ncbi:aminopeptidase N [Ornithinimicrobium tianjinense]|uniref:aminopeptidase N n=1 Tax=Ornithinimicrobium tianjinense TaxID=1195761 RepID=UPI001668C37B|nr:aminopeptidase N [Ornithinimicrobium tianjinense]